MAGILIQITGMSPNGSGSDIYVGGIARTSDMVASDANISWSAIIAAPMTAIALNAAVRDAAILAASSAGHSVGLLDSKAVVGGAITL